MSELTDVERDLCARTLKNLQFIDKAKAAGEDVFETTQLFNSLLGIIVNVKENENVSAYLSGFSGIEDVELDASKKNEWGIPAEADFEKLSTFVYALRNAVAHLDVEFKAKDSAEIKSIKFSYDKGGRDRGHVTFPVQNLKIFLEKFCNYIINTPK